MPVTKSCASYEHVLTLEFCPPYGSHKGFFYDVCGHPNSNHWLYWCNKYDFNVYLNCIYIEPILQSQSQILSNIFLQAAINQPESQNPSTSTSSLQCQETAST